MNIVRLIVLLCYALASISSAGAGGVGQATSSFATIDGVAQQAYQDIVSRYWFGQGTVSGQFNDVSPNGAAVPYPTSATTFTIGSLWSKLQAANVAYSLWKTNGSADALARLKAEWVTVKARWTLAQLGACGVGTTNTAQDDTAWDATGLIQLYEATGDDLARQYAKAALDCGWSRWQDSTIGGGLWYDDSKTRKSCYQGQYALASYLYYQDTSDATYSTRAIAVENWAALALYRNGQTVTALPYDQVAIGGTLAAGNTVAETFTSASIAGSPVTVTYTLIGGDTAASVATGLAVLVNGTAALTNAGIASTGSGTTQTVTWPANVSLTLTSAVTPSSGGPTATVTVGGANPGAGTYTYPVDGLWWCGLLNISPGTYGVDVAAERPTDIHVNGSVTMIAGNMAFAALDALLYTATSDTQYLTRLNATATGMRTYEIAPGTNVALNDRDGNVDGYAAWYYAKNVLPLLTGAAGTQMDKSIMVGTAWSVALAARQPDGTYSDDWTGGPVGGHSWPLPAYASYRIQTSAHTANLVVAGYYASLR